MFYRFTFEDGYICFAKDLSELELSYKEKEHGKLISKEEAFKETEA